MQTEQLQILRTGLQGQGVGQDGVGNIYFVPGAIPGDVVRVGFLDEKKYRDAELLEIITPSADRVVSPCKVFPECGGCDYLQWDYPSQLRAKEESLKHVLERADLVPEKTLPFQASPQIWGYRNRIQVRQQGEKLGFYRKKSHDLVDVTECLVAHPKLNEALKNLRQENANRKVELALDDEGNVQTSVNSEHAHFGFRQINEEQNKYLQERVAHYVKCAGAKKVLELFCGNGNLSFPMLAFLEELIGIDSNDAALALAREKRGRTQGAAFFNEMVGKGLLYKLPREFAANYDTLVLDPPRDGVGCLKEFLTPSVKRVIYISCNPVSFTKDVQSLKSHYRLREIQGIDMFPHTKHIELLAYFEAV
jgi:23S rRNA (uracil1939-C5)-methyltransferase